MGNKSVVRIPTMSDDPSRFRELTIPRRIVDHSVDHIIKYFASSDLYIIASSMIIGETKVNLVIYSLG